MSTNFTFRILYTVIIASQHTVSLLASLSPQLWLVTNTLSEYDSPVLLYIVISPVKFSEYENGKWASGLPLFVAGCFVVRQMDVFVVHNQVDM